MYPPVRELAVTVGFVILTSSIALADEKITPEQWRADLHQLAETLRTHHPDPFRAVSQSEFNDLVARLNADIPGLTAKQIVVGLAVITAAIQDGHTRLAFPRQHRNVGLELGHTGTPDPKFGSLKFAHLPVDFELFDDGLFVVSATESHKDLLRAQVLQIGKLPADQAMIAVEAVVYKDNAWTAKLLIPDRLGMPEILAAIGISDGPAKTLLKVRMKTGVEQTVELAALPATETLWLQASEADALPAWLIRRDEKFWARYLADDKAMYLQINEINDKSDETMAQFAARTFAMAEKEGAERLVIDLRHNSGGSGSLNRSLLLSILRSDRFNNYGKLFVLTGRNTFSAAQFLVLDLERYANVLFVGEPGGASPTSYGDPKKITLEHSGLTLRVSTIHWHSWLAGEFRDAVAPHIRVEYTSKDFFSARDPVLQAALEFPEPAGVVELCDMLLRQGDVNSAAIILMKYVTDPETADESLEDDLIRLGEAFAEEGDEVNTRYVYLMGAQFYPASQRLRSGLNAWRGD